MTTTTHQIIPCEECKGKGKWENILFQKKNSKVQWIECFVCKGSGYLIREECNCGLKEVYCHSCNSDGYTTRPLPKVGDVEDTREFCDLEYCPIAFKHTHPKKLTCKSVNFNTEKTKAIVEWE